MSIADQKLREIREQVQTHLASVPARLTPERQKALEEKIREQLKAHNAVIVAHYYTSPEIQAWPKQPVVASQTLSRWHVLDETIQRRLFGGRCALYG